MDERKDQDAAGPDTERILAEAKVQGIDLSNSNEEMVAKFAYCVSERILAGDPMKKAVRHCLIQIRDML